MGVTLPMTTAAQRATPQRSAAFAHLDLPGLRHYRRTLATEENRVSYWRRLVQARLDLLTASSAGTPPGLEAIRDVLSDRHLTQSRTVLIELLPADDLPPLPDLAGLWSRLVDPRDTPAVNRQIRDLTKAERQLSAYRAALHRRIAAATAELIARYREDPLLCLSALPATRTAGRLAAHA